MQKTVPLRTRATEWKFKQTRDENASFTAIKSRIDLFRNEFVIQNIGSFEPPLSLR